MPKNENFVATNVEICKVDEDLGLVFGMAIICKEFGKDYFDVQGDHIPEDSMLEAATNFMLHSRVVKHMHSGEQAGTVVFAFPLTQEIAQSMDIVAKKTGLLIAIKPEEEMLTKFRTGELTGFSIGGRRGEDEEVD